MTQRWNRQGVFAGLVALVLAVAVVVVSPTQARAASAGPYHIQFRHSGKCLDNYRGSSAEYNKIQQWTCVAGNGSQKWYFDWAHSGYAWIRNAQTGKCLAVADPEGGNGTLVVQRTCASLASQLWKGTLVYDGNPDYYQMRDMLLTICIDIPHGSTEDGTPVQMWTCVPGNRQQHLTWY